MKPSPTPAAAARSRATLACLLVWGVHALLLSLAFPLSELLTDAPIFHIDAPFHQYQMDVARELWATHALVGYDPWFGAGHVGGVNYNASAKAPALLATLLGPSVATAVAYKLYVFFAALLAPACVFPAMRWLRADAVSVAAATLLGFLLWWISALHWYHGAGMVAFVAAGYAALPYTALAWRGMTGDLRPAVVLALGICGALGILLHPLFPLPVIVTLPFLMLANAKEVRPRAVLLVALLVPLICLLPNIAWMLASIRHPGWSDGALSPFQKAVDIRIVFQEAMGRIEGSARGAKLNPVIWLCVAWALSPATDARMRRVAGAFVAGGVALLLFSAVGAWWPPFGTLQPNRQSAVAYLLLAIPAAIGIGGVCRALGRGGATRYAAGATAAALLAASAFFAVELENEVSTARTPHYGRPAPEVRGVGETARWLAAWIAANTSDEARVLFETSQGRIHDGAHVAGFLARASGREFIGGPYLFMHHADFWDGGVFGRAIGAFSAADFSGQLELYNVGWIVVHSGASKAYLDAQPQMEVLARHGPLAIYRVGYRVGRTASYFLEGRGRVVGRRMGRIELDDVAGEAVTLKYHFVAGLVSDPPAVLQAVYCGGDPQPFIRVLAPARRMTILFP
ncbi:hypothetical protein [Janthinobacterium sp.]|uniref:hypothetical protein n=1 Tax=Janthinobacterium sp. TaxID=1871054 RepID=UPI00293D268C|nr:hypothetical protein [Janthinobacterium sp.]